MAQVNDLLVLGKANFLNEITSSQLLRAFGGIALDDSTEQSTALEYVLGIKAFTSGGNVMWSSVNNFANVIRLNASGNWGINISGLAAKTTMLATARTIFGHSFDGTANVAGQPLVYGSYNSTAASRYSTGGIQIRENGLVGSAQSDIAYAPAIGFHWGGRIAASLLFHSDGIFYFRKQNFTDRATIDANVNGSLNGNAATATVAGKISDITTNDLASSSATKRRIWFCYDNNTTGRPAYDDRFTIQTSTGTLFAPIFSGNLSGNATTATTAAYANKININGISNDTKYGTYGGIIQDSSTGPNSGAWHNTIKILHNNSAGYYTSIATQFTGDDGLWFKSYRNGVDQGWKRVAVQNMDNTFSGTNNFTTTKTEQSYGHHTAATYTTTASNSGYYKIKINSANHWMTAFTIRVYQSYKWSDIVISGYNYGDSYWYSPVATMLGSSDANAMTVYFGYDSVYNLWVGIPASSYTGIDIIDVTNGYQAFDSYKDLFTISNVSSLGGTTQVTQTIYRPWYRNERVSESTTCEYPAGFASRTVGATWGNTTGTSITSWNDATGGSVDWRRDNPSSGKISMKVDGRVYVNEGNNPVLSSESANGYWGMCTPDGANNAWIRTTTLGIIPYQSAGHGSIGTSGWPFNEGYFKYLNVTNDASNTGNDALAYFRHYSNNDWTVKVDSGSYDYGLYVINAHTATNAFSVTGGARISNTLRIGNGTTLDGNFCEGLRIRAADGQWATIVMGATADTGTNANAWSIHRKADNNFCISRNSSDGANGLVMTATGMGLGTTAPSYRLHVAGDIYANGGWLRVSGSNGLFFESYGGGFYMSDTSWVRTYNNKNFYCSQVIGAGGRIYTGYDSGETNSVSCSNWFRSSGNTGWYNATHAGGWYMSDATYLRSHNNKAVLINNTYYVGTTAGAGTGLSLYGTSAPNSYGIHMSLTSNYSKHGFVQGDWAMYFCFDGASNRGWIFKQAGTNVASISGTGGAKFDDTVFSYAYTRSNNKAAFMWDKPGSNYTGVGANGSTDTIQFRACDASGNWVDYKQKWAFYGKIEAVEYIYSATYLQAAAHIYVNTGSLNMLYNNTWYEPVKNHNNGNITLNAASGNLYIGYQTTNGIIMSSSNAYGTSLPTTNLTTGRIYYKLV